MKRRFLIFLAFSIFFIPNLVEASTNVFERTEDNLQVADDIVVTEDNIDNILNTPKVDEKEKIYDFADLFTEEEEFFLYNSVNFYIETYDMDMVIVTINDNNKLDAGEYAKDFYDYNYFGKNDKLDGIIYLIDMDTREVYIDTSGNAKLVYDDDRIDRMLDKSFNSLSIGRYYQAAKDFVNDASVYASSGIPDSNEDYFINDKGFLEKKKSANWAITIVGALTIPTVVLIIFISKHKGIKLAVEADNYIDKDKAASVISNDTFLTTHTSRVAIPKSTSSSSGGRSGGRIGGSSISHGSSGRSHGGGGRHF